MVVPAGEKLTDEQVAAAKPDVIILAWAATGSKADPKKSYELAAWHDVPAIRNRRVRIATVLPALIGARTLTLLRGAGATALRRHIKVPRKEVRAIVLSLVSSLGSRSRINSLYRELSR